MEFTISLNLLQGKRKRCISTYGASWTGCRVRWNCNFRISKKVKLCWIVLGLWLLCLFYPKNWDVQNLKATFDPLCGRYFMEFTDIVYFHTHPASANLRRLMFLNISKRFQDMWISKYHHFSNIEMRRDQFKSKTVKIVENRAKNIKTSNIRRHRYMGAIQNVGLYKQFSIIRSRSYCELQIFKNSSKSV